MTKTIDIYTDGACSGNPGPGGWGALLLSGSHKKELSGGESHTTNNRMELKAVIEALRTLNRSATVRIYTDSQYVLLGITQWIEQWKKRGWKTSGKQPVKNEDLWRELDALRALHHIEWLWVHGHAGNTGNERADLLARSGIATNSQTRAASEVNI